MRTSPIILLCLTAATLLSGCSQKKVAAAPQQPPPPAAVPSPTPEPAAPAIQAQTQQSQALPGQGTPPPEPQQPTEAQPARPAAEKSEPAKAKTGKHANGKKTGTEAARNSKQVVKAEGDQPVASAGQISPSLSHAEIAHDQATIEQLLQSTEATLNGIKRDLSPEEQAKVAQVHDYVNQSRQATKANDLTRAYNLAMKARLLSDDVAKPR